MQLVLVSVLSLVKMVFSFCKKTGEPPTWNQFEHAIRRNFGGLETVDCVQIFKRFISLPVSRSGSGDDDVDDDDDDDDVISLPGSRDNSLPASRSDDGDDDDDDDHLYVDDLNSYADNEGGTDEDEDEDANDVAVVDRVLVVDYSNSCDEEADEEGESKDEDVTCVVVNDYDGKDLSFSSSFVLDCSPAGLIRANLGTAEHSDGDEECRYLLLLTENYAALNIVRQQFLVNEQPVIIFGSSFSKDQEYTQICRNINRIKVCMATGRTVVLLNLEKLYESLYDALNQYYVRHGGQKFVDLGLGSHRVKCQVHDKFRLILIADREVVYKDYPIPLINRMEKHFLAMSSILSRRQERLVEMISKWVQQFADVKSASQDSRKRIPFRVEDAFIGYHSDAVATVVLQLCSRLLLHGTDPDDIDESQMLNAVYEALLQCATPDAVARLSTSAIFEQASNLWDVYFSRQNHSSLADFLENALMEERHTESSLLIQVTTHSRLLSSDDVSEVERRIGLTAECVSLQQFDTEHQFATRIRDFYAHTKRSALLIILCESADVNGDLVACARYVVQEKRQDAEIHGLRLEVKCPPVKKHVVFVIHLPRIAGGSFVGFQGGTWTEAHIDDLRPANQAKEPSITSLVGRKISELLEEGEETIGVKKDRNGSYEKESRFSGDDYCAESGKALKESDAKETDWQTMQASADTEELVANENETETKEEKRSGEDEKSGDEGRSEAEGEDESDSDNEHARTQIAEKEEEEEKEVDEDNECTRKQIVGEEEEGKEDEEGEMDIKELHSFERRGDAVLSGATLLRSCVHGATSRLDNHDEAFASFKFANRRLNSLLVLIPENETSVTGHRPFYHEVRRRCVQLLQEREERMGDENATDWVKKEAFNPNGIQAGGTFRHSLWLKIVNIVTPIFSEIIASIDVDANLNLLTDSTETWIAELWMKIFSSSQLLHLCYQDFISPNGQQLRQRVRVHGSGHQGHFFQAKFPFSKLIKDAVDVMMEEAKHLAGIHRFVYMTICMPETVKSLFATIFNKRFFLFRRRSVG